MQLTFQTIYLLILLGLIAGIMSGLVGIGGGIVLVPLLVVFMQYSQHQAQGTSLGVLTLPVVVLGFLKYYFNSKQPGGNPIDVKVIGWIAIGFIVGGYFGSSLALKIDKQTLRKIFAIVLFYTAFKLLDWDTAILRFFKKSA